MLIFAGVGSCFVGFWLDFCCTGGMNKSSRKDSCCWILLRPGVMDLACVCLWFLLSKLNEGNNGTAYMDI